MGFARDLEDATAHSPAVPKVGFFTAPVSYTDIAGNRVDAGQMDLCARVISVFKCHKACPLTAASSIAVAAFVQGSIIERHWADSLKAGRPSGWGTQAE